MDATKTRRHWKSRGFSFGIFRESPGRIWPDFSHSTDEFEILAEGQIEIEVEGVIHRPVIGEEIFIPAQAIHTVRKFGTVLNVWYYGYRVA
jgi:quercetin dioxygenase-like cupin family protein